jgi:hypothetical protein
MLHLFKKVYLDVDSKININEDRIVMSDTMGLPLPSELNGIIVPGLCIASGKTMEKALGPTTLASMLLVAYNRSQRTGKRVIIYADRVSFDAFVSTWYKTIMPNASAGDIHQMLRLYFYKETVLSDRWIGKHFMGLTTADQLQTPVEEFAVTFDAATPLTDPALLQVIDASLSIEYYLASYLHNGSRKSELKKSMRPLLAKDLEQYMYELKEIIILNQQRPVFQTAIGTTHEYNFDNFYDFSSDPSPSVQVMFNPAIWTVEGKHVASSRGTVVFDAITDGDMVLLKQFAVTVGFMKPDATVSKLDFISFYRTAEFSDDNLATIIDYELAATNTPDECAGSFYSIDLETVNNFLVEFLFNAYTAGDFAKIAPYTV